MREHASRLASIVLIVSSACACDAGGERPEISGGEAPSDTGGSSSWGGQNSHDVRVALPFVVDHHFHATGYMGAAVSEVDEPPVLSSDRNVCRPRPEGAQGRCHYFRYAGAAEGWVGLYWLAGYENWGESPGLSIEPGPTRVRFYAASNPPGLPVQFMVGGVGSVDDPEHPHADTFVRTLSPDDLTTTLVPYEIDLRGAEYDQGVLGGFGWFIFSSEPGELFIDDIRWE
jgi:hypothetical protein